MDILTEMRLRLDVAEADVSDARLQHFIDVATEGLDGHIPTYNRGTASYQECVCQLAIKIYDTAGRGTISMDAAGEWVAPSPAATQGLIQAIWGIVAPLTLTGAGSLG